MTDPHTLVGEMEALKQHHEFTRDRVGQEGCPVRRKAAEFVATIDAALAMLKAQREALEPFAKLGVPDSWPDNRYGIETGVTAGEIRKARAALEGKQPSPTQGSKP